MTRYWRRLAFLQTRYPAVFVASFALLVALGTWRASQLKLVTDFADLLSQDQPSVVELRRIVARTRGLSTVHVVLEGDSQIVMRQFADALVPRLRAVGGPYVETARSGVQDATKFLRPRAGLFLTDQDLSALEQRVARDEQRTFRQAIGADLDASDDSAGATGSAEVPAIEKPLLDKLGILDRYPGGYFQATTPSGLALVIEVKATIATGDVSGTRATLQRVQAVVRQTQADVRGAGTVQVGYAGDLLTSMAEYDLIRRDVLHVGGIGTALVMGVVLLFFRKPGALIALALSVGAGSAMTFGLTELVLGHLNVATAFLFSVVVGNGVNFGIIWLARFIEERRSGQSLEQALALALERTWGATFTAACAAATAYAALGIGEFRGFRHFAFIGGMGMLLCWATSYLLLPAVVVLMERARRRRNGSGARRPIHSRTTPFEKPFRWVVTRAPGKVLALSLALGAVALVVGARYLWLGPLEYDMLQLQSDRDTTSELYRVSHLAGRVVGSVSGGGIVVLTDHPTDTPLLAEALRHARDQAPPGLRPFQQVHTLDDLVPPQQAERLVRLRELARRLTRAHDRGGIDDGVWARIESLLPPKDLLPFDVEDLPRDLVEPFTEKDGTRGRILYIEQTDGQSDSNLHYLLRLADAFRRTRLPDGRVVQGSGRAMIFADLLQASLIDMPRSVMLSLALTALVVVVLFRRFHPVAMVLGSLLLALAWMLGIMAAADVRLNFINFIALPITFGIGIDYAVNLYRRFEDDRAAGMAAAMRGVGGAVVLCSLTTSLGYFALLRSHNLAVRSLGMVAVLGEVTCLVAALLALPAAVMWREQRRRRAAMSAA